MKKLFTLVALLASMSLFFSCNQKQDTTIDQTPGLQTYTLTISAVKNVSTKKLVLNGSSLDAVWAAGEVVKVYKEGVEIGSISPVSPGSAESVLSGTVTVAGLAVNDWINLVLGGDFSGQDGSLENIHDFAKAWFQVGSIEGNAIIPKIPSANESTVDASGNVYFNNWTAIVRFNVKKDGANLSVKDLTIRTKTGDPAGFTDKKLTISPSPATNQIYVALSNYDGDTPVVDDYEILVTSASDNVVYSCLATTKTFLRGKFYDVTLKVTRPTFTVAGSSSVFTSNWDPTTAANDLVYDSGSGLYSKTFAVSAKGTVEFKVVRNHAWESGSWPGSNYSFVFPSAGTLTITFSPATEVVNATGSTTKTYTVAGTSDPSGVFASEWAPTDTNNNMTLTNDGSYYKVLSGVSKDTVVKFKVCEDNSWDVSYGYRDDKTNCANDGGNCKWTATQDCDLRIWVNPGNDHYIYVEEI